MIDTGGTIAPSKEHKIEMNKLRSLGFRNIHVNVPPNPKLDLPDFLRYLYI